METTNSDVNSTEWRREPHIEFRYTTVAFMFIGIILYVMGDVMLTLALMRREKLRGNCLTFVVSMIVQDALTLLLYLLPLSSMYITGKQEVASVYCKLLNYIGTMAFGITVWHIAFVLLNEYVTLSHHDFFSKFAADRATWMQLIFSWSLPTLIMISGVVGNIGNTLFFPKRLTCVFTEHGSAETLLAFNTILCVFLPGIIAGTCIIVITCSARKHHAQVWDHAHAEANNFRKDNLFTTRIFTSHAIRLLCIFIINTVTREAKMVIHPDFLLTLDLTVNMLYCSGPWCYPLFSKLFRDTFLQLVKLKSTDNSIGSDSSEDLAKNEQDIEIHAAYSRRTSSIVPPF